ncbi:hypothetical protein KFK09_019202 [Dendrobium nobile]|uniref:Uncharacterized protein n=1 Tax=Dendrobium nobile TaxID=94219 RepID=A0A8T3AY77_DENNO|nr:hypothetical protein KFK09_019202 [Dendrobium nobile]
MQNVDGLLGSSKPSSSSSHAAFSHWRCSILPSNRTPIISTLICSQAHIIGTMKKKRRPERLISVLMPSGPPPHPAALKAYPSCVPASLYPKATNPSRLSSRIGPRHRRLCGHGIKHPLRRGHKSRPRFGRGERIS